MYWILTVIPDFEKLFIPIITEKVSRYRLGFEFLTLGFGCFIYWAKRDIIYDHLFLLTYVKFWLNYEDEGEMYAMCSRY